MERIYSQELPRLKEVGRIVNPVTHTTLINFDVREEIDSERGKYSYLQVEMYPSQMRRSAIISAVIRAKYDQDKMEAIINNYLEDPTDEDALAGIHEMQSWRNMAKLIAKEALEEDATLQPSI